MAIESAEPLPRALLASLREALEESTIPNRVDVVDLAETDAAFRDRVRREGIQWIASGNAPSKIERDAAIQRFEYSFEATWKSAQRFLAVVEGVEAGSPKSTVTPRDSPSVDDPSGGPSLRHQEVQRRTGRSASAGLKRAGSPQGRAATATRYPSAFRAPAAPSATGPVLVTAQGVRVEGLDRDTGIAVLRALG